MRKCERCRGTGKIKEIDRDPTSFIPTISEFDCPECRGNGNIRGIDWVNKKIDVWIRSHQRLILGFAIAGLIVFACGVILNMMFPLNNDGIWQTNEMIAANVSLAGASIASFHFMILLMLKRQLIERMSDWLASHRPLFWKLSLAGVIMLISGFLLMLSPDATYTYQPLGILSLILSGTGPAIALISILIWLMIGGVKE